MLYWKLDGNIVWLFLVLNNGVFKNLFMGFLPIFLLPPCRPQTQKGPSIFSLLLQAQAETEMVNKYLLNEYTIWDSH